MSDNEHVATEVARLQRRLKKSQQHREELEHLIDTGQAFQRRVLSQVEQSRKELQMLNDQVIKEQKRINILLRSIMPDPIAAELKQTGAVVPRRHDNASIMFTDFVGFTEHAEALDPVDLVRILDQYYSEFDRIVARHGVEKVKTIGDAYMCVTGLSDTAVTADTIRDAAHEILHFVQTVRPAGLPKASALWQIRIGINSGAVSTGVIGQDRLSFDVWGGAVNVASRVVAAAAPNTVLLADSTSALLVDRSGLAPLGAVDTRGADPVDVFLSERSGFSPYRSEPQAAEEHPLSTPD